MLGRTWGAVLEGAEARLVAVEVDLAGGLPSISAVGLPDSAVREGVDRVRAALRNGGFRLPQRRITLNFAPAGARKTGTALDLPIAIAILAADAQIPSGSTDAPVIVGELGLDGSVRSVRGALAIALAARRAGHRRIVVPAENADEAALVGGIDCYAATSLSRAVELVSSEAAIEPIRVDGEAILRGPSGGPQEAPPDLADVRGQPLARRALEVCAAGGHHLLLSGPPGCGKTMLAERLVGILPPPNLEEALEITRVWSAEGLTTTLVTRRPFRAPHHAVTPAGLVGGGVPVRAGEVALASGGVLFLDELPEFKRDALETLRTPLEAGRVTLRRVRATFSYPARFTLIASMNPCPCGYHGEPTGRCRCGVREVERYLGRLSGPLLDRFDVVVALRPVPWEDWSGSATTEGSAEVRQRVMAARSAQTWRFREGGVGCNSRMGISDLDRFVPLTRAAKALLREAAKRLGLSARGLARTRRVARTIADLDEKPDVTEEHLSEAVLLRTDRPFRANASDLR